MKNKLILSAILSLIFSTSLHCSSKEDVEIAVQAKLKALDSILTKAATGHYNNPEMLKVIQTFTEVMVALKQFPEFNEARKSIKLDLKAIQRVNNQKNPNSRCSIS